MTTESETIEDLVEDLAYRMGLLEEEVRGARRAAETTRSIAIALLVIFVGLPGLLFVLGFALNLARVSTL